MNINFQHFNDSFNTLIEMTKNAHKRILVRWFDLRICFRWCHSMNPNNLNLKCKRYFNTNTLWFEKTWKLFVLQNLKFIFFVGKGVTPRDKFMKYVEELCLTKKRKRNFVILSWIRKEAITLNLKTFSPPKN